MILNIVNSCLAASDCAFPEQPLQIDLTHLLGRRRVQTLMKGPQWFSPQLSLTAVNVCLTRHIRLSLIPRGQLPTVTNYFLTHNR